MLFALNYCCVFIYGLLVMVFLLDIKWNKRSVLALSLCFTLGMFFQLSLYFLFGSAFLEKAYPLIVHLPLLIFFNAFFKKRLDWVLFVLCTAYILTTPRRWIGDLIALPFNSDPDVAAVSSIIMSFPLLLIAYKFIRPYFIKTLDFSQGKINLIGIVPLIYYVLAYLTTVYTHLLYTSRVIVIGILTTGLTVVFYYFLIAYIDQLTKRFTLQNEQNVLAVQISSLQLRAETMKQAEEKTRIYRHDMRHHLNLIGAYLADNNKAAAQKYIAEVDSAIDDAVVPKYCGNYTLNLILYSYITKAVNDKIKVETQIDLAENNSVSDMDLCVIFSNAIENATNACKKLTHANDRRMNILCKNKDGKLFIQITNTYDGPVTFVDNMPVRTPENHGLGTKSIVAVVEKYGGLCSFTAVDRLFSTCIIL